MQAALITASAQYASVSSYVYGATDAARKLGVSESTVRRHARKLGVRKTVGKAVAGFVCWDVRPVRVTMPYFD